MKRWQKWSVLRGARITHFMNKFRKLGLIDYNGEITVRAELLTDVVLHD